MTTNNIKNYFVMSVLILSAAGMIQSQAFATTGLNLGKASNFVILSGNVAGVITNGVPNQPIARGYVGHTSTETAPFTFAAGFKDISNPVALGTTTTAGTPIGAAHAVLASIGTWDGVTNTGLPCTFTFANGAIDLSTDTTHGPIGQYGPGVYCIDGAASIGTAGINFNTNGTYVFKINGALTTVSGSTVTFNGAAGCSATNLYWAPVGGASTGATSQFSGTVLAGSAAITTGANTNNTNARFVSESAITIGGGANLFSIPALHCICIPAHKI
jgi:ice-binding like protein